MGVAIYPSVTYDTGWIYPTLLNSWAFFGAPYSTVAYRKIGWRVQLKGLIKSTTSASENKAVFVLPAGFRPAQNLHLNGVTQNVVENTGGASAGTAHTHQITPDRVSVQINIDATGNVVPSQYGNIALWSLDGISFLADL